MSNEQRRKQRKAKKTARTARRKEKAAAKAQVPKFDPSLPVTAAEIEAAMEATMQEMIAEGPGRIERDAGRKTIHMTPSQAKFMQLKVQLFRVVFGREPGHKDPIFWDRSREHEGIFPIDPAEDERQIRRAVAATDIRPEVGYAMALTGMVLMEQNEDLFSKEDLEDWEAAIEDYRNQAAKGVIPLTPNEFIDAWMAMNRSVSEPHVTPASFANFANMTDDRALNRLVAALRDELGSSEKAVAAMTRIAALVALADTGEIEGVVSSEGYTETAVCAAANAEIDVERQCFRLDDFQARMDALDGE